MRVLIVIPSLTPEAGAEQSIAAVLPYLTRRGVEVDLAVLTDNQGLVPDALAAGANVHDLSGFSGLGLVRSIRALIRSTRPDLVHATLVQATVPTQIAAIGTAVRVLVTWANTPTDRSTDHVARWKLEVVHLIEMVMAHTCRERFHAVTEGVARTKAAELHVSLRHVSVAERGRDPERFHPPTAVERAKCRDELGMTPHDQVLLAVGRQEPQKGYDDLIRAFDSIAVDRPCAHLLIAGRSGSGTPSLEHALEQAANASRVHVLGHREDVVSLLHAADVVVCASHREGAAGALIEAMGCGTPIVSVELDGLRGVLVDGVNSRFVPRRDLAAAIVGVLDDPEAAETMAAAGLELFLDRFTIERSAASLLEVYAWADPSSDASTGR